jgi:hypothetical protein
MFDFGLSYKDWTRVFWTFVQAFLAALYAFATGLGRLPEMGDAKAALWAAALAGIAAVLSLLKNFLLADSSPVK